MVKEKNKSNGRTGQKKSIFPYKHIIGCVYTKRPILAKIKFGIVFFFFRKKGTPRVFKFFILNNYKILQWIKKKIMKIYRNK